MTAHALPGSHADGPRSTRIAVTTAAAVTYTADLYTLAYPLTVCARPGSGGTLLVEYRVDAEDGWIAWPSGAVSAVTVMKLSGPVQALRFTATVADGVVALAM